MIRLLLLFFFILPGFIQGQEETFSDYFASSEDYGLRQVIKNVEGRADTLLGRCVDSILVGNTQAVLDISRQIVKEYPAEPLGYLMRSVAWADRDNPPAAMADIDRTISMAPKIMLAYIIKSRYYLLEEDVRKARETLLSATERMPDRPEPPFLTGALDYREGHAIRARKLWEQSIARDSCYVPARVAMLRQRFEAGRMGKGIRELESLQNCEDVSPDVFHLLSLAEAFRKRNDKSLEYVNIALDLDPGAVPYLQHRIRLYTEDERFPEAVEDLYDVFAARSSPRRRIVIGSSFAGFNLKVEGALNYYMRNKAKYPVQYRYQMARQLINIYSASGFDDNRTMREALRSEYKEEAGTLYFAGLTEAGLVSGSEKAQELFDAALEKDPNIPDIYRIQGEYLLNKEDFKAAYSKFVTLSELQPLNKYAWHGMAKTLSKAGRTKGTVHLYTKVLEIDSNDVQALLAMGNISFNGANYQAAMSFYDKYLELEHDQATVRHNRAVCRYLNNDFTGASADLGQLSSFYRANSFSAINLRGLVRLEMDSLSSALGDFNQVIFNEPDNIDAQYNRARTYFLMEDWRQCIGYADALIENQPEYGPAFLLRATAKHAAGDTSACDDLKQAVALGQQVSPSLMGEVCGP